MEVSDQFFHISLGNILEIVVLVCTALAFIFGMRASLGTLGLRMQMVEREIKKLGEILITLGRYEERFLRIEDDIWDIKHGKGYVKPSGPRPRDRPLGSLLHRESHDEDDQPA